MTGILEPRNAFLINKPAESDLHGARSHLEDYCSKTMWGVRREELSKLVVISHRPQLLFKNYSVQVLLSFLVLPYVIAKKTRIGLWSRKGSYGLMLTAVSSGNPLNARPCLGEGGGKYNYILRTAFGKIKKWFSEKHTEFIKEVPIQLNWGEIRSKMTTAGRKEPRWGSKGAKRGLMAQMVGSTERVSWASVSFVT